MDLAQDTVLLVEGNNDKFVIVHFSEKVGVSLGDRTIYDCKDDVRLLRKFEAELKSDKRRLIGLVIDADDKDRWAEISRCLTQCRFTYEVPKDFPHEGLVLESQDADGPRIGIWIMPNNRDVGILEDFVRTLIPSDDELLEIAEETLARIENEGKARWKHRRAKAFIHTWLAWQEDPGEPMGRAIQQRILQPGAPLASQFEKWLRCLFASA